MLLSLIVFILILSLLVIVHEFGHFLLAKKAGMKVEQFSFGFPPKIWGIKIGETQYCINAIPFGGFVKIYGEDLEDFGKKTPNVQRTFWSKSLLSRTLVIVAGVVFNFLLAIVCFSVVYSILGIPEEKGKVEIAAVLPDSPAQQAGLLPGDKVYSINEVVLESASGREALDKFSSEISAHKGEQVKLAVLRDDNPCLASGAVDETVSFSCQDGKMVFAVTPRLEYPDGEGPTGVAIQSVIEMKHYPIWQMPFKGAVQGLKEALGWTQLILDSLGKMVFDLFGRGLAPKDVAGPIGIFQITDQVARTGVINIIQFIGVLSVNLAILNIMPFPALDGGRLVFIAYEAITRRRPKPDLERWVNSAGFAFLIGLIVLVTVNDLVRVLSLSSFFAGLVK